MRCSNKSYFAFSFLGKNPRNVYVNEGNPLAINAVKPACGPGTVSTLIPSFLAATTCSYPGSLSKVGQHLTLTQYQSLPVIVGLNILSAALYYGRDRISTVHVYHNVHKAFLSLVYLHMQSSLLYVI